MYEYSLENEFIFWLMPKIMIQSSREMRNPWKMKNVRLNFNMWGVEQLKRITPAHHLAGARLFKPWVSCAWVPNTDTQPSSKT